MSLIEEYQRQLTFRDWKPALELCPILPGQLVLDLGCSVGDISRELAARGAQITGVDSNPDLLAVARSKNPVGCTFVEQDLRSLRLEHGKFDGLWCSFTAAYFVNFEEVFKQWTSFLKQDAWVCIIEMDDLLGHDPLSAVTKAKIDAFYRESLEAGRYDFRAGSKIRSVMETAGFRTKTISMNDRELCFNGPADKDVLLAWRQRLDRMPGLQLYLQDDFIRFREEFLSCLSSPDHKSSCRVICGVG